MKRAGATDPMQLVRAIFLSVQIPGKKNVNEKISRQALRMYGVERNITSRG